MSFGERLKEHRLNCRMTLESLAILIGTSRQTIQRYESGKIARPPYEKIEALAAALSTTPGELMGWQDEEVSVPVEEQDAFPSIRVEDDAMVGDRILERDIVYYRPADTVEDGQLVVLLLDGAPMVRRYHRVGEHIVLSASAGSIYPPILLPVDNPARMQLLGVATLLKSIL